jgi:hypothetical protein
MALALPKSLEKSFEIRSANSSTEEKCFGYLTITLSLQQQIEP